MPAAICQVLRVPCHLHFVVIPASDCYHWVCPGINKKDNIHVLSIQDIILDKLIVHVHIAYYCRLAYNIQLLLGRLRNRRANKA